MSHLLCYRLIPVASSIIGHGLQETTDCLLVKRSDASVLLYKAILDVAQSMLRQSRAQTIEDVGNVKTELARHFAEIRRRRITSPGLVVCLRPFGNTDGIRNLVLRHTAALSLFLQSGANLFGKVQNYSSLIFTNASKCIIVHLTPHEIARICTMPNTSITEQARQQAREVLEKRGQTAKNFAELHDLNPSTVYAVLSGQSHCRRGEAHRAAVLLGIKDGVIEQ